MCKATKDFTVITDNGSKKESFEIKKAKQTNTFEYVSKRFTECMNSCKAVQMKKTHILIIM